MFQSIYTIVRKHWTRKNYLPLGKAETKLSSCGWHMGFRDIPYLHSKTLLSLSFLEIRHPSVRSLQQWEIRSLPVPIIWHIVYKKQFLARGNSPDGVSQGPAQLRAQGLEEAGSRNEPCTGAGPQERQGDSSRLTGQQLTQTGDRNYAWPATK